MYKTPDEIRNIVGLPDEQPMTKMDETHLLIYLQWQQEPEIKDFVQTLYKVARKRHITPQHLLALYIREYIPEAIVYDLEAAKAALNKDKTSI